MVGQEINTLAQVGVNLLGQLEECIRDQGAEHLMNLEEGCIRGQEEGSLRVQVGDFPNIRAEVCILVPVVASIMDLVINPIGVTYHLGLYSSIIWKSLK
jgi:hypothetical protein